MTPDASAGIARIGPKAAGLSLRLTSSQTSPSSRDTRAEHIHGISVDRLLATGEPVETVAARLRKAACSRRLYSNDVGHDERWLRLLLKEAGDEPNALKLWCASILFRELASARGIDLATVEHEVRAIAPIAHRADDDARYLAAPISSRSECFELLFGVQL